MKLAPAGVKKTRVDSVWILKVLCFYISMTGITEMSPNDDLVCPHGALKLIFSFG